MFISFRQMVIRKQILNIPEKNKVSVIEIYYDYANDISKVRSIKDGKNISEIYNVLLLSKKSKMKSIGDIPSNFNGKLTKIILIDNFNNEISLFVYKGKYGKYYVEKPYEGIYKISVDGYKVLTEVFEES